MEFFSLKPEGFGLDISDLSLKILKLRRKKNGFYLECFGNFEIEPGIIEGGVIKNEDKLVRILQESMKKVKGKKLKTQSVVASLPEEKAFLQVIQMPQMSEEDLKSAILFEAENYIPLPVEKVYLDCEIVSFSQSQRKMDVLLAAVPREIVDSYFSVLKRANLKPIAFEVESYAIVRALIKKEINYPILILDLGATRTSFIIFYGKSIGINFSIPISSTHFTEMISQNLGISFAEAEEMKRKYGLEERVKIKFGSQHSFVERGKIFESLIPSLIDLVQQIKKYLDYYETHIQFSNSLPDGKKIQKIILCGGGANLKGLPEFLELELKIPIEIGNPLENIFLPKKDIFRAFLEESLSFTTAIGLAQRI